MKKRCKRKKKMAAKKTAKKKATKKTARKVTKKGEVQLVNVGGQMIEFPKTASK